MDNLFNDELYYEKLEDDKLYEYIDNMQLIILEILNEKDNYDIKYINVGIKTLVHIMYNIFINTKNIDIMSYYGKTSVTYYFEFINQICSNSANDFVNISLKDAVLFVYKKTIFNLNSEYKKGYNNFNNNSIFKKIFCINDIINMLHIQNNYNPVKYKNIINKLIIITNTIDINIIRQIMIILIDNNIDNIKIINFITSLSKNKKNIVNNSNLYNYNYDNFAIKTYINHILST
jgi:hypothetical protein